MGPPCRSLEFSGCSRLSKVDGFACNMIGMDRDGEGTEANRMKTSFVQNHLLLCVPLLENIVPLWPYRLSKTVFAHSAEL